VNSEAAKKWVARAESDLKIGKDELVTAEPATDAICFHMQQCVEKYLKVFLIFNNKPVKRTHNITELIHKCSKIDPEFEKLYDINADELTDYAVDIRYAESFYFPTLEETKDAVEIAERVKSFVLNKLKDMNQLNIKRTIWKPTGNPFVDMGQESGGVSFIKSKAGTGSKNSQGFGMVEVVSKMEKKIGHG
jgi:HEPN domain-containing protein